MADRNIMCATTAEGFELSSDKLHGTNKANRVAGTSTSFVGLMPPVAASVTSRPVAHPPTNTSSSSTGRNSRTTRSNSSRLGSLMEQLSQSACQLAFGELAFARAAVTECVDERE